MTTTFSATRDDIINAALRECGAVGTGETAEIEDISDAAFALNLIIKSWIKTGMPLWKVVKVTVPMVASNITYQIGPTASGTGAVVTDRPLRVLEAFSRESGNDSPLTILSRGDYESMGAKTTASTVNAIYYQPLIPNGVLTVYPAPSSAVPVLHLLTQVPLSDVITGTDVVDFPSECYQALKWNLCAEIAGPYVSSDRKIMRIEAKAKQFKEEMESWSVEEASLYFGYDTRS